MWIATRLRAACEAGRAFEVLSTYLGEHPRLVRRLWVEPLEIGVELQVPGVFGEVVEARAVDLAEGGCLVEVVSYTPPLLDLGWTRYFVRELVDALAAAGVQFERGPTWKKHFGKPPRAGRTPRTF